MSEARRQYTEEFKEGALRLIEQEDKTISQIARDLGIRRDMLQRWKREAEQQGLQAFPGHGNPRDEELARLKKENAELKEERDILKKALAIFSKRPK
jgi:transposase